MRIRSLIAFVVLVGSATGSVSAGPVDDIVAQVSQTSYQNYLGTGGVTGSGILYTHAGDNRGDGVQHDLARSNIFNTLSGFGLATTLGAFTYESSTYYNVVAVKPGTVTPNDIYIVGAHYDSANNNPGADDNASGMAGVLEAARVLSQCQFKSTLVFIGFDREEQGMVGSTAYATAHAGDNIKGMVSLDMIAYNPEANHDKFYVYGRDASNPLKQSLAQAITSYGGLGVEIGGDTPYSDHAPFEAQGKQAALLIEYNVWSNPYYHQAADNVETANYIDYQFATQATRGTVGYLATAAVPVPEPGTLVLLAAGLLGLVCYAWRRRRS